MEAPTPVSALLHAATLVTAGIYLLLRCSPILEYSPTALLVITLVGATTAFFAATCGLVQNDLKRIIAFSTISQLGYMVMAIGLSQYNVALFHTVNHAFFKALLFLGAGQVIHSFGDQQDIRKMGGLIKFLPFVYSVMLVGTLSLLATPFLTGFYSKDLIIELAYGQYSFNGIYAYILGTITAGLTAFYSFRLISLVFLTNPNGNKNSYLNSHESDLFIIIPLIVLSIFSIFFGYLFSDMFVGLASDFFGNSLFIHPNNINLIEAEFSLNIIIKLLPTIFTFFGVILALYFYNKNYLFLNLLTDTLIFKNLYNILNTKYYFDIIYNNYIFNKGLTLGYIIAKQIDRGILEFFGPYGLSNSFIDLSNKLSKADTGQITSYAIYITISTIFLIGLSASMSLLGYNLTNVLRLLTILFFTFFVEIIIHKHNINLKVNQDNIKLNNNTSTRTTANEE
jgi:NADH-ubiquinone oxidoreductase chain 5